ncbi:TetR/AcrR family transcriptional regulator [Staphylococcus pseudoxylosus]|uniref:TetR/AcrR family transcriptional regulator n=1 Tax=Staphylococcus pseudoxylosus TaxID=2282419 RepID=UPI000D1F731D|nr:TetR/AcrR family transcriptional regulator [Staphylococcus pseudoxylosus]MEB6060460.1 TetR/AcrR family transcriptional regulator [Staphylococcus pseudoxylosus]MEB7753790.1 TetR/AcrR family transcriptional regulator [Staphylococcus pseudoxylosus]PTI57748.1 TetR family transcriptional regulator [Staphylococcus xylosus]
MPTTHVDPRITRTKKLLMDAFRAIAKEKKLQSITVKDITDRATVNRATFYAHFYDKYDIMDYTLSETLLKNLNDSLNVSTELNEETLCKSFITITSYIQETHNECKLNSEAYGQVVEKRVKEELEDIFLTLLVHQHVNENRETLATTARFLSWGLYGTAKHWFHTSQLPAQTYIKQALPFLMNQNTN